MNSDNKSRLSSISAIPQKKSAISSIHSIDD